MKATGKDFYREIKKSTGRFLSILFIVALGVAFFSGLRASEPDMRLTGDAYFDSGKLMDIKVVSTLGMTEDDIQAFGELSRIERAEGAYSADFLTNVKDDQYALRVMSICDGMNEIQLEDGRLPKQVGECLADAEMGYEVGDTIELISGNDDAVTDTLKTEKYRVVGVGSTPMYISFGRGSTTIGTGSVEGFLFVPADTFDLEVYTEAYLLVDGARELVSYTEEYESLIDEAMEDVRELSGERGVIRRRELVDEATKELDKARADLEEARAQAQKELDDAAGKIADASRELEDARQRIASGRSQIADAKEMLAKKQRELDAAKQQYEAGMAELESGREQYEAARAQFEAQRPSAQAAIADGEAKLAPLKSQMEQFEAQLVEVNAQLDAIGEDSSEEAETMRAQLQAMREQLEGAIAMIEETYGYSAAVAELETARQQLAQAEAKLDETKQALDAAAQELQGVPGVLRSGQEQIDAGWAEIRSREAELGSAQAQVAAGETELNEAKAELEEGRTEAARELAKGEEQIDEAEQEIEDIPHAEWYIYDRNTLPEYSGYGENADRMKAIGRVFPIIFFLVAALISLTSMTRMVEEQRVQIGTMKALGYSNRAIAKKYMGYAFLATAAGSVLGFLVGEKVLPFIIIYAYGIMYHHIPEILTPYIPSYALQASAVSVLCTLGATWAACIRELRAQPAVLMRPPAPKSGKRVLLERIPAFWKHLNFTWKSTVRNLMRYKKRFFMTIFGISGCMGMMILGYGIRDSVYEIAQTQYEDIQVYDGQIILQEDLTEEDRANLDGYLGQDEDVERFMDVYMKNVIVMKGKTERETYLTVVSDLDALPDYVRLHDRKTKESYQLNDSGVIVSEKTAKLLDVGIGDSISIKDEIEGAKEVVIANIVENYMGHYMYMTPGYYEQVFGEAPVYNSILFSMDDSFDKKEMEEAGKQIVAQDEVLSITYLHDVEEQLDNMLGSLNLVIIVLIVSAGMLAFVVLYNLNTINITERQRELATLKVLGFYNPEVAAYVFRENIILTLIGAAGGVVLGKILHLFIIETVEVDAVMFGRSIYAPSFLYSLLFTIAFSLLINGIMYVKLKKIDMVESLKSVE